MKITMNKEMTTISMKNNLKEAMKEFKARYTDYDLRNALHGVFAEAELWEACNALYGDIIRCDVDAFPEYTTIWVGAHYAVEMVIESTIRITRVRFYVDQDLKVDTGRDLITMRIFDDETGKLIYA